MNDEVKRTTPPYTTFKSFTNLIEGLKETGVPTHISRSIVKGSNSGKAMMTASLKSLGLITEDLRATDKLRKLVGSEGEEYKEILSSLLQSAYPFLFDGSIDLQSTTTDIVAKKFQEAGASGSTISKCMAFFIAAAKESGMEVSPHLKVVPPPRNATKRVKAKKPNEGVNDKTESPAVQPPAGMEKITVPLRGMPDGVIHFPASLEPSEARRAVKAAVFILNNFYELDDE